MAPTLVACGYFVEQDYMRTFFDIGDGDEYDPTELVHEVTKWRSNLNAQVQAKVPRILPYVKDVNIGFASCVFFVLTRVADVHTSDEGDKKLLELDADKHLKQEFIKAFGRGFLENQMEFGMKFWPRRILFR